MSSDRNRATSVMRHEGSHFCVATYAHVIIVVWGRVTEVEDVHELSRVQREVVARYGHCQVLTIIRAGLSTTVKDGVREAGQDNMREFAKVNLGSALIVEGGGFRMVFFRSVLTSVLVLARAPVKQRVFDNIDEGVQWLLAQAGVEAWLRDEVAALTASAYRCADAHGQPV